MKRYLLSLILVFAVFVPSHGGSPVSSLVSALTTFGLPVVEVTTVDGEEPTYEDVDAPEGCLGGSIRNAVKVPGRVMMCDATGVFFDSGPYEKSVSGMTIKVRGNWSARRPQKPFKIKLQRPANMLIPAAASHADRNWLLMPFFDLRYMVGLKVSELMGMPWTPQFRFVNLVFNGRYHGLYMLMESVERNPACRLNVSESGFIAELDAYWWNEDVYAKATFAEPLNYTFKYPEGKELTMERLDSIQRILSAAEQSMLDGTYQSHIDVESFARWMLAHDILGNRDGAGSNMFLTKYDDSDTTLLRMDCLWDLDVIMESEGWDELHDRYFFGRMFHNSNRAFVDCYIALWDELKDRVTDEILQFLEDYLQSELRQAIDASIRLNNERWTPEQPPLPFSDDFIEEARNWFLVRRGWLDYAIYDPVSVSPILRHKGSQQSYDLFGRKVVNPQSLGRHTIYIQNGKKMLNK